MMKTSFQQLSLSLILLIGGVLIPGFGQAQQLQDTIRLDTLEIEYTKQSFGEGFLREAQNVLTFNEIQSDRKLGLTDYFHQLPGVFLHSGADNTHRMSIRGIGSRNPYSTNRIKMYYGDIPISDGEGETSLGDLEMLEIGRLSLLKGPSSALYGGGLAGVIQFQPKWLEQDTTQVVLHTALGSYGLRKIYLAPQVRYKNFQLTLGIGRKSKTGFRNNSEYDRKNISAHLLYRIKRSVLQVLFQRADVRGEIPSSLNQIDFTERPESAASNWAAIQGFEAFSKWRAGLQLRHHFNSSWISKSLVYIGRKKLYESRPFNILSSDSQTMGARQTLQYSKGDLQVRGGGEFVNEASSWTIYETLSGIKGSELRNDHYTYSHLNLFGLGEYSFAKYWKTFVGLNWHQSNRFDQGVLSPRLGINYSGLNNGTVHASIGHGFSSPSLEEAVLPDGQYNRSLLPEQGWNLEGGLDMKFLDNKVFMQVSLYQIFLSNLIVSKRVAEDQFIGINAGSTNHRGIEYSLAWRDQFDILGFPITLEFENNGFFGRFLFSEFVSDGMDYSHMNLPGVPNYQVYSSFSIGLAKGFETYVEGRVVGKQYLTDQNDLEYPGYSLFDLGFTYQLPLSKHSVRIFGGLQNLFDQSYASMLLVNAQSFGGFAPRYYYPGAGRNYFIGARITF